MEARTLGLIKATPPATGNDSAKNDNTRPTRLPFAPSKDSTANFALFDGFYVPAQVIER